MEVYKLVRYKDIPIEVYKKEIVSNEENHRKQLEKIHHWITNHNSLFEENIKFSYLVDEETGKIKVRVYNFRTGEVIQEVPSDQFLKFIQELKEGINTKELKDMNLLPSSLFLDDKS
ncbi:MAG: flagellar protein FlaG [Leptonema sp. (in: bacteria)]